MPVHTIQPSFAGGEFAPSLYPRIDLQKYAIGCRTVRNFIIHPSGGASNRPGTKYRATVKYSAKKTRLVPFIFSTVQAYVIEFGDQYCRFYMNGGQIQSGGAPYEIATPYLEADLNLLKFTQSADVLFITHPKYAPRTLTRSGHTNWKLDLYNHINGPFMPVNTDASKKLTASGTTENITLTSNFDIFQAGHVGALFQLTHLIDEQNVSGEFTAIGQSIPVKCKGTWRLQTHGTWTAKFDLEVSYDGGTKWITIRSYGSSGDYNPITYGQEDQSCLIRINVHTFTSGTLGYTLTIDPYEQEGIVRITGVTDLRTASATVLSEIGFTTATEEWAEGSWSDYRGYPVAAIFYDDRLIFAGTPSEPQTIWGTKTGLYTDFGKSNPLADTDRISVTLLSRQINKIENLVSLGSMIALTNSAGWTISGADGGSITPTSIRARCQEYRGSSPVAPVVIGNRIIYIQSKGFVVRDIGYVLESDSYTGDDLSIFANHLLLGHSIVEMDYQQDPDSIIWMIRSDGILLGLTYLREQQVLAWHRHDTDGQYESLCVIPGDQYDEVWVVVKRGNNRYIEQMVRRMASNDPEDQFFVDSGLTYDNPVAIGGITLADPIQISATAHGLNDGDYVEFSDIRWAPDALGAQPIQLNGMRFVVANATTNTFTLQTEEGEDVDGTTYTAYISGGYARKAVTEVSGLEHLEGKTVAILANGNVHPQKVVSSGAVTLDYPASRIHIGLPYTSDLETLNIEFTTDNGIIQGRLIKVSEVVFQFDSSRGGWIGPDADNLTEIFQRSNEPMGSPIALYTGPYEHTLDTGYEPGGRVFFRQVDPLPVTILSIVPTVDLGEQE